MSLGPARRGAHLRNLILAAFLAAYIQPPHAATQSAATQSAAAQSNDEPVYAVGNGVTIPRVTHQVDPDHPARGFRISGTVLIGLIVTSKGDPKDVHVVRSLDKDVDQAAVDAVKQWHFDPATKEGKPVAVKISVEIRFHDM